MWLKTMCLLKDTNGRLGRERERRQTVSTLADRSGTEPKAAGTLILREFQFYSTAWYENISNIIQDKEYGEKAVSGDCGEPGSELSQNISLARRSNCLVHPRIPVKGHGRL